MISKEVLKVSKEISKFGANHVTVPIFTFSSALIEGESWAILMKYFDIYIKI